MSKADARAYLNSLEGLDIIREFKVWEHKPGEYVVLDAHHLQKILKVGIEDGLFTVPDVLPCHVYDIPDRNFAAKIVLAHSSVFARVQYTGFDEFAVLNDIAIESAKEFARIPSITWAYWDELEGPNSEETDQEGSLEEQMNAGNSEEKPDLRYKTKKPKISFPTEPNEYSILLAALKRIKAKRGLGSLTDVLKHLISYEEEIELNESELL